MDELEIVVLILKMKSAIRISRRVVDINTFLQFSPLKIFNSTLTRKKTSVRPTFARGIIIKSVFKQMNRNDAHAK